jgi:hypothetical protein
MFCVSALCRWRVAYLVEGDPPPVTPMTVNIFRKKWRLWRVFGLKDHDWWWRVEIFLADALIFLAADPIFAIQWMAKCDPLK